MSIEPVVLSPASLTKITESLSKVLKELAKQGLQDRSVRCRYAEYLVARILTEKGHKVQMLNGRGCQTSADIFLPQMGKCVEVKSSCFYPDGWAYASFSDGNQIKKERFDYCVWIVFDKAGNKKRKTFI